jgi:hypothetical protein
MSTDDTPVGPIDHEHGAPQADPNGPGPAGPRGFRRLYGATPAHLLLHLAGIALCAWALKEVFGHYREVWGNLLIWLVAGALLNDFVALPLYVGIDRLARRLWGPARQRLARGPATTLVPGRGHVRVPVAMSAALLLVYLPNILGKAPRGHQLSTGLAEQPDFAGRWLLITAGLLLASLALYLVRVRVAASGARRPSPR